MSAITEEELDTYDIVDLISYCRDLNINLRREMIEKKLLIKLIMNYEMFNGDDHVKDVSETASDSDSDSDINIYFK